jgi:hypothetical protein
LTPNTMSMWSWVLSAGKAQASCIKYLFIRRLRPLL